MEELLEATRSLSSGKNPGMANIVIETVVAEVIVALEKFLEAFNRILLEERIPAALKKGRVVLLKKPGRDPGDPAGYRPLCLLSNMAKLFEKMIMVRLTEEIGRSGGLSPFQFGFSKGYSTVRAVTR